MRPGESKFNPVWAAGIDALLSERYTTAAAKLCEANALLPNLTDVKRQLAEADVQDEESAAAAIPVGVGHARRLAPERRAPTAACSRGGGGTTDSASSPRR